MTRWTAAARRNPPTGLRAAPPGKTDRASNELSKKECSRDEQTLDPLRSVVFPASQQEVVAAADHHHAARHGRLDAVRRRIGAGAVHLYDFLRMQCRPRSVAERRSTTGTP